MNKLFLQPPPGKIKGRGEAMSFGPKGTLPGARLSAGDNLERSFCCPSCSGSYSHTLRKNPEWLRCLPELLFFCFHLVSVITPLTLHSPLTFTIDTEPVLFSTIGQRFRDVLWEVPGSRGRERDTRDSQEVMGRELALGNEQSVNSGYRASGQNARQFSLVRCAEISFYPESKSTA